MKNKNLIIGLGVLAVAGIGYYMWKKKSENKSGADGDYSNAQAASGSNKRKGIKICNCPPNSPSGSGDKPCSKSMLCKDCCAGSGLGDT